MSLVPTKIASVGPPMASSFGCDGPGKGGQQRFVHRVTKDFVYKWTIPYFRHKMETMEVGEHINSASFTIGDTKWHISMAPAGYEDEGCRWPGERSIGLRLVQSSRKSVNVSWDWFVGKDEDLGQFVRELHMEQEWVNGRVKDGSARSPRNPKFVTRDDVIFQPCILVEGNLELITKMTVEEIKPFDESNTKLMLIDDEVKKEVTCPVCFEMMTPPAEIWQCVLGHPVCGDCKRGHEERSLYPRQARLCPTCREPIIGRSIMMENLVKAIFAAAKQ